MLDPAARFSDGKPVTRGRRHLLLAAAARQGPAQSPHLLRQGRQGGGDRRARGALRSRRQRRSRTAADPRADAGAGQARDQSRDASRRPPSSRSIGSGPYRRRRGRSRQERDAQAQSRTTGGAISRSTAASGISTRSASTTTATSIRISRRSSAASTTCASRPIRRAGRPATIFPPCATAAWSRTTFTTGLPKASVYFVFNTRRPVFADIRVREAIAHAVRLRMDQPQLSSSISIGAPASYFEGSELSAHGRPADARERALLAPFPDAVRADVLDGTWSPPVSDGSGRDRTHAASARSTCSQAAGYELRGTELVERQSGRPFTFEIMVASRDEERLALAVRAEPQARRHHGAGARRSMPCNTRRASSPTIST